MVTRSAMSSVVAKAMENAPKSFGDNSREYTISDMKEMIARQPFSTPLQIDA